MTTEITNSQDIIDSRDVIERIQELEAELTEVKDGESTQAEEMDLIDWIETLDIPHHPFSDTIEEYKMLTEVADEASGYSPDWQYGSTLIRDSYFEDYAQETAEDCGMIQDNASWPYTCIDWEKAARELQMDYTSVEFDGVTYWVR